MSRSYKKTLGWCDRNPWMKNYANRRLRRLDPRIPIPNGGAYKKFTEQWDICDYKILYFSAAEVIESINDSYFGDKPYRYYIK